MKPETLKIAASICYFEDKQAFQRCLRALQAQTWPLEEILVVDNRSELPLDTGEYLSGVTRLCHWRNIGPTGAAATAFDYALERGYDAVWVLDQDSRPHADALEKLVCLYESFSLGEQQRIGILATSPVLGGEPLHLRILLPPEGERHAPWDPSAPYGESDTAIWSGSLYRLDAVKHVGLPRYGLIGPWHDFNIDYGDLEFGCRIKEAGYRVLIHPSALLEHSIGNERRVRFFGRTKFLPDHAVGRRYLSSRNRVYFWLYLHPRRRLLRACFFLAASLGKGVLVTLLVEPEPWRKIRATVRGAWDGVLGRLERSYT